MITVTFQVHGRDQEDLERKAATSLAGFVKSGYRVDYDMRVSSEVETYSEARIVS